MVAKIRRKGLEKPTLIVVWIMLFVIALLSIATLFIALGSPFRSGAEQLSETSETYANVSLGNFSEEKLSYEGRPYDVCGNNRGSSRQNSYFATTNSDDVPIYPEFYECTASDCCKGFVYEHILDFGSVQRDNFVHIEFFIQIKIKLNHTAHSCDPLSDCCLEFPGYVFSGVSGDIINCTFIEEADILFYYSKTGLAYDWEKFYHEQYSSGGRKEIILPIGGEYKFVKVFSPNIFIDYIEGQVIPWEYQSFNYLDVCNSYFPSKRGFNYLYDSSGEELKDISLFTRGQGYIINMREEGEWTRY